MNWINATKQATLYALLFTALPVALAIGGQGIAGLGTLLSWEILKVAGMGFALGFGIAKGWVEIVEADVDPVTGLHCAGPVAPSGQLSVRPEDYRG